MVSGVCFEPPSPEELLFLAVKHNGIISDIADELKTHKSTLYNFFRENESAKAIIDYVRSYNHDNDLDIAEKVNRYNMLNYEENASLAQRAAEFTLTEKGQSRGWNTKNQIDDLKIEITHINATSDNSP